MNCACRISPAATKASCLALGYSTQRGCGRSHPFAGEIRLGEVEVEFFAEEVGFAVPLGAYHRHRMPDDQPVQGIGNARRRASRAVMGSRSATPSARPMSVSLVDRALRARELDEDIKAPAQDEEFVLSHSDNVQATGFVEHLKLPHYVDFQSELGLLRTHARVRFADASPPDNANSKRAQAAE